MDCVDKTQAAIKKRHILANGGLRYCSGVFAAMLMRTPLVLLFLSGLVLDEKNLRQRRRKPYPEKGKQYVNTAPCVSGRPKQTRDENCSS